MFKDYNVIVSNFGTNIVKACSGIYKTTGGYQCEYC